MTNLVILTDGGGGIGFGHFMRCLAIKSAWNSTSARLLAQMEGNTSTPINAEPVDWLDKIEELKQYASTDTILLVDSYRPDANYFNQLKSMFPFVAVLDDYNRITYPVDLVICPGVYRDETDYSNQTAAIVGGSDYVILRPEVLNARQLKVVKNIETVLVTFGGSQQDETLYQKVINVVEQVGYHAVVVTGNETLVRNLDAKNSVLYGELDPVTMAQTMASSDLAVSAAGQTLNELTWLGVPSFAVMTGEDQHGNWSYYKHHGLCLEAVSADSENLESTLNEVLSKETAHSRFERSGELRNLLTNTGANAICSLLESMGCS